MTRATRREREGRERGHRRIREVAGSDWQQVTIGNSRTVGDITVIGE
jgi:hypothetical protein